MEISSKTIKSQSRNKILLYIVLTSVTALLSIAYIFNIVSNNTSSSRAAGDRKLNLVVTGPADTTDKSKVYLTIGIANDKNTHLNGFDITLKASNVEFMNAKIDSKSKGQPSANGVQNGLKEVINSISKDKHTLHLVYMNFDKSTISSSSFIIGLQNAKKGAIVRVTSGANSVVADAQPFTDYVTQNNLTYNLDTAAPLPTKHPTLPPKAFATLPPQVVSIVQDKSSSFKMYQWCDANGTQGHVAWEALQGADVYALRVDDRHDTPNQESFYNGPCGDQEEGDYCINGFASKNSKGQYEFDFSATPGDNYGWWIQPRIDGVYRQSISGENFKCTSTPNKTPQ